MFNNTTLFASRLRSENKKGLVFHEAFLPNQKLNYNCTIKRWSLK